MLMILVATYNPAQSADDSVGNL